MLMNLLRRQPGTSGGRPRSSRARIGRPEMLERRELLTLTGDGQILETVRAWSPDRDMYVEVTTSSYFSASADITARAYDSRGRAISDVLTVANSPRPELDPAVSVNARGDFAVSYTYQYSSTDADVYVTEFTLNSIGFSSPPRYSYGAQGYAVAVSGRDEFDSSILLAENGNFAVSYTYQYSSNDSDIHAVTFSNGTRSRPAAVAQSYANESNSRVAWYDGSASLTVAWSGVAPGQRTVRTSP
jgi:hypothetical protein